MVKETTAKLGGKEGERESEEALNIITNVTLLTHFAKTTDQSKYWQN